MQLLKIYETYTLQSAQIFKREKVIFVYSKIIKLCVLWLIGSTQKSRVNFILTLVRVLRCPGRTPDRG